MFLSRPGTHDKSYMLLGADLFDEVLRRATDCFCARAPVSIDDVQKAVNLDSWTRFRPWRSGACGGIRCFHSWHGLARLYIELRDTKEIYTSDDARGIGRAFRRSISLLRNGARPCPEADSNYFWGKFRGGLKGVRELALAQPIELRNAACLGRVQVPCERRIRDSDGPDHEREFEAEQETVSILSSALSPPF